MAMRCPRCNKEIEKNPDWPFCSERCKLLDLGNWISETYRIPQQQDDEDESGPDPASGSSERE